MLNNSSTPATQQAEREKELRKAAQMTQALQSQQSKSHSKPEQKSNNRPKQREKGRGRVM